MTLKILSDDEKQEIEKKFYEQFGILKADGMMILMGKERLFLYSGSLSREQIKSLESSVFIERIGVYFAKIDPRGEVRLSIEGSQILKNQINKNIFELSEDLAEEWMKGRELDIKTGKKGFLIMKYKDDFLGTGKASENKIGNFIPKNRRLREKD